MTHTPPPALYPSCWLGHPRCSRSRRSSNLFRGFSTRPGGLSRCVFSGMLFRYTQLSTFQLNAPEILCSNRPSGQTGLGRRCLPSPPSPATCMVFGVHSCAGLPFSIPAAPPRNLTDFCNLDAFPCSLATEAEGTENVPLVRFPPEFEPRTSANDGDNLPARRHVRVCNVCAEDICYGRGEPSSTSGPTHFCMLNATINPLAYRNRLIPNHTAKKTNTQRLVRLRVEELRQPETFLAKKCQKKKRFEVVARACV